MTSTPMIVPIIPRFMEGPPLVPLQVPAGLGRKQCSTFGQPLRF
jgi:hypothetical protein